MNPIYKKGDKVILPFDETGTVKKVHELIWWNTYDVKIRKENGFEAKGTIVEFLEKQLKLES